MPSILFVCTANLYRSPLAAAFLRKELINLPTWKDWAIDSAGTWTRDGIEIHHQTIEDAHLYGLDLSEHQSKQVNLEMLASYDLILVMEAGQKEALSIEFPTYKSRIFLLSEVVDGLYYDIPDPFSSEGKHDREIIDELFNLITRGRDKIMVLAKELASKNRFP